MKKDVLLILSAGHGGVYDKDTDKMLYSVYQTKRYKFDNGEMVFEKDLNQDIKNTIVGLCETKNIPYYDLSNSNIDIPLPQRVGMANSIKDVYPELYPIYLSFHHNASINHNARGFEMYIYNKASDKTKYIATNIHESIKQVLKDYYIPDRGIKSANFYELKKTAMPSVLFEVCFFDNEKDMYIRKECGYGYFVCLSIVNTINEIKKELL